jgi:ribonuclease Z
MRYIIFSKALYSTWIYYSPHRLLFDAGEGVSTSLGNKVYAVNKVFLSHSHTDHIAGLWGLINIRNNAMGDREKPLQIYYPKGNVVIEKFLSFIGSINSLMRYEIEFFPLKASDKVELDDKHYVEAFLTRHTPKEISLGYRIMEKRNRLKKDFSNFTQEKIRKTIKEKGKDYLIESYIKNILTVSGDSLPIDYKWAFECEELFHDTTFLSAEERKGERHATLEEVLEVAKKAKVKTLYLYHISTRYNNQIKEIVESKTKGSGIDIKIVYPYKIQNFD